MPSQRSERAVELRILDVATFVNVVRTGSITASARELGVTPSQVSKAVARVEAAVRARLCTRGAHGLALTPTGRQLLPRLEQMLALARSLGRTEEPDRSELTIAAPSSLLPPILPGIVSALPQTRVRGIELLPVLLRGYATEEIFDVAILPDGIAGAPTKWANVRIGELRKSLLASPAVAKSLGPRPTVDQIRRVPFVAPVAYDGGRFVAATDDCPLRLEERTLASEVGTMDLALRLAADCGHLVFGPVIAAQRELREGSLVEIQVEDWNVTETLFLACHNDRVLARAQAAILGVVHAALASIPEPRRRQGRG